MELHRSLAVIACAVVWGGSLAQAGELRGRVRLEGAIPAPAVFDVTPKKTEQDAAGCDTLTRTSQQLMVDADGGIRHAVVWVEEPPAVPIEPATPAAVLDQQDCTFGPHVVVVPPGGHLTIRNSDPVLHNIRIYHELTRLTNAWQKQDGEAFTWKPEEPGPYLVRCGVHKWMHAWVMAAAHHYYAVTDSTGGFRLPSLPAGPYVLHTWHETLGEQQQSIDVNDAETVVMVQYSSEGG